MEAADLRMLARIAALGAIAWLVPSSLWRPLRVSIMSNKAPPTGVELIEEVLGRSLTTEERFALAYQSAAGGYEDVLRVLRSYRPGGWRPDIELIGEQYLRNALELGNGVILWVPECVGTKLVTKMALARAGFDLYHLSRPTHGFSPTAFGIKFLNPHWQRIENRFVKERLVLTPDNNVRTMKRMRQLMKENRIVTVTDVIKAKQKIDAPFLNGRRPFASGPINLASRCKSAVLPLFCVERGPTHFEVHVGENLAPPGQGPEEIVGSYSKRLGVFVQENPHLWLGWKPCHVRTLDSETETQR